MTHVIVGRWGRSLAIRVPAEVAREAGLADGDPVEIEAQDGDIVIRRQGAGARARADALAAAAEIIEARRGHTLGEVAIRDLLDEGRRG
jgi:antitoxin component of MazEF toxin-antitoxin module